MNRAPVVHWLLRVSRSMESEAAIKLHTLACSIQHHSSPYIPLLTSLSFLLLTTSSFLSSSPTLIVLHHLYLLLLITQTVQAVLATVMNNADDPL